MAKQPSAYGDPIGFLMIGVIVCGLGFLALADDGEAAIPEWIAYAGIAAGGLLVQIGVIAVGVLMGTERLRRGGVRDSS